MRIFLTGLPGAGKTYLGKLWAEDNGLSFYDLDLLIEEEERMDVSKIFATYGEGYFREKEAAILRNTDRFDNCIIACGGGTSCFFDNADWMNRNGLTVFLDETLENISTHLKNAIIDRPLLPAGKDELENYIKEKSTERYSFYNTGTLTVSAENLNREGFAYILQNIPNA